MLEWLNVSERDNELRDGIGNPHNVEFSTIFRLPSTKFPIFTKTAYMAFTPNRKYSSLS